MMDNKNTTDFTPTSGEGAQAPAGDLGPGATIIHGFAPPSESVETLPPGVFPPATDETGEPLPKTIRAAGPNESATAATASTFDLGASKAKTLRFGDYELLTEIARGGMGVVYKARQVSLNRIVALKMILAGQFASASDVQRFRAEATAAARLDHPNIVPIYEIGEHGGQHYFTMKLVHGGSLEDLVFAGSDTKMIRLPEQRWSAQLAAGIARAVHHAHQRGILHRDLKPANILLQRTEQKSGKDHEEPVAPYGMVSHAFPDPSSFVPMITDFGLAKQFEAGSDQTGSHAIVGTPSYMSPEQASGQNRLLTTAVDVYGIGAILYELLSGRPPFVGETVMRTLDMVRHQEAVPPSRERPGVDRDLETICLKCLQKEPAHRYSSAEDLAEDLERYLNDQPILARPIPVWQRTLKWARRRPAQAGLVGVSVLAVVAVAGLILWSYIKLSAAYQTAETLRVDAEERSRKARRAVDDMFTQVADKWLVRSPQEQRLQEEFLHKAMDWYNEFSQGRTDDPTVREEKGQALFRLGLIYRRLGRQQQAEQSLVKALEIQQELHRELPAVPGHQRNLAATCNWLGEIYRISSNPPRASAAFQRAIQFHRQLVASYPKEESHRRELARSLYSLGLLLKETRQHRDAEKHLNEAVTLLAGMQTLSGDPEARHQLALSWLNLGTLHNQTDRPQAAREAAESAINLLAELSKEFPHKPEYRHELAVGYLNLSNVLRQPTGSTEHRAKASEVLGEALRIMTGLVTDFPLEPSYRSDLANVHNSYGAMLVSSDIESAAREWDHARGHLLKLSQEFPDVPEYRGRLGVTLGNRGWAAFRLKDLENARRLLTQSIQTLEAALKPNPDNPDYLRPLRNQHANLVAVLHDLEAHEQAIALACAMPGRLGQHEEDFEAAARMLLRRLPAIRSREKLDADGRRRLAEQYAIGIVTLLRDGSRQGYSVMPALEKSPDYALLKESAAFKAFLTPNNKDGAREQR